LEEAVMDRAAYAIYRVVAVIIGALPLATGFRIGWALGTLAYHVAWPYRRLVLRNLAIAFSRETSCEERRALARRHFATLGANLMASIKLPTLSRGELEAVVTVEGLETLDPALVTNGRFVAAISHLGNWEMFAQFTPLLFKCQTSTIYQRLGNRFFDAELRRNRARLGVALFERKAGFAAATRLVREGGGCAVLVDQHAGDAGLWCPFFERLASTSTLAATLALRTGAVIIPAAVYTDGVARWRFTVLTPIQPQGEDAATLTIRINEVLETQIRRQPEDWFWVHNRWKTPKPKFLLATYKRGVALPPDPRAVRRLQPFRMLIRGSNWLGDAVMSVAAVRAIKQGRPDAHVTILTPSKFVDFWKSVAEVDHVIAIQEKETVFATAKRLRAHQFEAAILFPNSLRVALEAWLARIPRRVGYPGHHRAALLNQVPRPKRNDALRPPRHQVHDYLALAEFVGADLDNALSLQPRSPAVDDPLLVLGVCPGAEYGPAKRWLPERFAEVMCTVSERRTCQWKVFGVSKDRVTADAILRAAPGVSCTDLIGRTTLAQLIDELRTCRLLLTNDTGTMHLAAHLGVPTVAIFGSTEPALTGPLGGRHRILRHHVECSPCFLRECPIDFRCMKAVQTSEVVAAIEEVLDCTNARMTVP
jgi:heptosyltransferase-2